LVINHTLFFRLNLINSAKIDIDISSGVLEDMSNPIGPWISEINFLSKPFSSNLSILFWCVLILPREPIYPNLD